MENIALIPGDNPFNACLYVHVSGNTCVQYSLLDQKYAVSRTENVPRQRSGLNNFVLPHV